MFYIDDDNNIHLTRGNTAIIDISITDDQGEEYNLHSGDVLEFSLKRSSDFNNVLLNKRVTEKQFTFVTNDTINLSFGTYKYDITLFGGNGGVDTFISGDFNIESEVHE